MAEKKYQVFISSTYSDLKEERRKILDILLMADCIPAGMEAFVASDVEQFEVIKKVIELCDYYILIIGKRYGSINDQTGLSYTEMEYEYAKELGIPVLVFVLDDSVSVEPEKKESDPIKIDALKAFKEKALTNRLVSFWKTLDDLTGAVAISIMRAIKEIQRPGWMRATDYDETSLRKEIIDLQKKNEELLVELYSTKLEMCSLTYASDVAYETCTLTIVYNHVAGLTSSSQGSRSVALPDLFNIIAIEMLDVSISEEAIEKALLNSLFGNSMLYSFSDKQFVKKVLNQLKALNLISSHWDNDHSILYWELTTRGKKLRDENTLIKTKDSLSIV